MSNHLRNRPHARRAPLPGLLLAGLGALGCAPGPPPGAAPAPDWAPRLVVLYATCTLNKDFLDPYGSERGLTPNLDAFADEGTVFRRHESESGQSGISFASIFSGTQSDRHGVYHHPRELADELFLVGEAFAQAGYETWFWSGHPMAAAELNYGQGVAPPRVVPVKGRAQKLALLQPGEPPFEALLAKLAADPDYRAFVMVNFTVTHGAYHRQIPEPAYADFVRRRPDLAQGQTMGDLRWAWDLYDANRLALQWDYPAVVQRLALSAGDETRLARALELTYAADVEALDALFGRTLSTLEARGLGTDSLVAFTADHGETLFRDNALFHWTHGLQLAPEVLSVPFILRAPELLWTPGSRRAPVPEVQAVTRSIDVFPTLAGLCGLDLDGRGVSGEDLSAVLRGEAPPELLAFSHTTSIGPLHEAEFRGWGVAGRYFGSTDGELIWVRVRQGDRVWKWINVGEERFEFRSFDLATDPEERRDLFDPGDERDARMAERLRTYKDELLRGFQAQAAATGSGSESIPADALERLQGLGYVDGDDPDAGH